MPLINGPEPIPDKQITASSEYTVVHGPRYARLNNTVLAGAWCPSVAERDAPTPNMYIQVCVKGRWDVHLYVDILGVV